jgi:hypothetical protein
MAAVGHTLADTVTKKPMREQAERNAKMMGILDVTLNEM